MASSTSISKTGLNNDNVIFAANESEVQHLDAQHTVIFSAMPQLILAPIELAKGGYRVLDQATGSGIWLRDVRHANGGALNTWIGTDIEDSYFPLERPDDTSYHHQSMTEPWPLEWQKSFDLVHSRMALPGVGLSSLEDAVVNLVGLVRPGGWIQLVEIQWQDWDAGPVFTEFRQCMRQVVSTVTNGQGVDMMDGLAALFEKLGLTGVQHAVITVPVGAKAKEDVREISLQSMFATASFVTVTREKLGLVGLGENVEPLGARLMDELRERGGSYNIFALWAQNPV